MSTGAKSQTRSGTKKAKQEPRDALSTYRAKRDFDVTPEPPPGPTKRRPRASKLEFVVQKHDATRLHYDVRIEIAGAMMSWAVPKGPSFDPTVKRLAVETEDHPMAYNRFEGRIPDGEYGAGDVLIWDRGTYETVPPGQEEAMRAKGHLHVRFYGEKLIGEWHFVRTARRGSKPTDKNQWLMFKAKDEHADPKRDVVSDEPGSVVSGKSATRGPRPAGASRAGQTPATLLSQVGAPMRAELASGLPDRNDYLFEVKYDGYRLLVAVAGGHSQVVTRKGNDWTSRFAPIARAVESLPVREAVLDGEACIVDAHGRSSFEALQGWLGGNKSAGTLVFAAFDLLWTDGRDLRGLPIEERRQLLEALVKGAPSPLAFSRALDGSLRELEAAGRKAGLEGLIAKRKGSSYGAGVTGAWWKLKFRREEEVAIAGYIPRSDADDEVGALLIAVSDGKGGFEPAGRVGTGFDKATRKKLAKMLDAIASDVPTVTGRPRVPGARWAKVKYVAQIALTEWTRDGSARAPSFLGLREDKEPSECVRERETEVRVADHPAARSPHGAKPGRMASDKASGEEAPLTNPKKVIFPRDGITKTDIAEYYSAVSRVMLPHLAGRPVGLQRWPNGIDHDAWFQQNAPEKVPPFVTVIDPGGGHDSKRKILVQNEATLIWLANLAALTIHQWASHLPDASVSAATRAKLLEQADYTVIDLDPGDGPWAHLVKVAKALRSLLEKLDLASVVKTSGQRGLHILIPWRRGPSHEDATDFGRKIASAVAAALPEIATVERMKAKRGGRLYIDFLQNGSGKTIVAPYSIRAKDGAPVSTPVEWSEVTDALDPKKFTIRTVPERVAKKGDLLAPLLTGPRDMPAVR